MKGPEVAVVVPTIRQDRICAWFKKWEPQFIKNNVHLIIVEDNEKVSIKLPKSPVPSSIYSWKEIDKILVKPEIIPRRTDCIRSFGFLIAYRMYLDVVTMDDDVYPGMENSLELLLDSLRRTNNPAPFVDYSEVCQSSMGTPFRGFPFKHRNKQHPVAVTFGQWWGVPDYDAITQLSVGGGGLAETSYMKKDYVVHKGVGLTGCIMFTAILHEYIPLMYQLLMGKDHPYDRWGDIWSALFAKRILDATHGCMTYSQAACYHSRASSVAANLKKEASGYVINEVIWEKLQAFKPTALCAARNYIQLGEFVKATDLFENKEYSTKLGNAMITWAELFLE